MFEGDATRANHGMTTQSSIKPATKSQMQAITLDSEYPRIKENFALSLSMKTTMCLEATRETQICGYKQPFQFSNDCLTALAFQKGKVFVVNHEIKP